MTPSDTFPLFAVAHLIKAQLISKKQEGWGGVYALDRADNTTQHNTKGGKAKQTTQHKAHGGGEERDNPFIATKGQVKVEYETS